MIDPIRMTRYGQTQAELEETILFCVSVAGKNALTTAKGLDRFLGHAHSICDPGVLGERTPFYLVRYLFECGADVPLMIKEAGLGCYNQRARTYESLAYSGLDLKTCTVADLEAIPGIGPKTSRFFLLHTRPDVEVAVIDTHVLKFLRFLGHSIPDKVNLSAKRYSRYEKWFVESWRNRRPKCTLAAYDLAVWNWYAGHAPTLEI